MYKWLLKCLGRRVSVSVMVICSVLLFCLNWNAGYYYWKAYIFRNSGSIKIKHSDGPGFSTTVNPHFDIRPVNVKREEKYNWSFSDNLKPFAPALNITEYNWYLDLIGVFKSTCEKFNITYTLEGGSVLGAYRYHGFVPWDDDFDVKVNASQKEILKKALQSVKGHTTLIQEKRFWKLWNNTFSRQRNVYPWNWPFLDIFFFTDNGTHIRDISDGYYKSFLKSDIFPLQTEIFENMVLPVPRNMEAYLNKKYNISQPCLSNWWNHKDEKGPIHKSTRISCDKLKNVYAVVHRFKNGNFTYEELRLGNKTLYTIQRLTL